MFIRERRYILMKVIVTGGAGFIGSHTVVKLVKNGHDVLIIDNFSNSHIRAVRAVENLTGKKINLVEGDITHIGFINDVFKKFRPEAILHFAGLKSVSESLRYPLNYYNVNVSGTLNILAAMDLISCKHIIFSSSATVYGYPLYLPIDEVHPVAPVTPYGKSKLMTEQIIEDWCNCGDQRRAVSLRYFNPVGAHPSGSLGENPLGKPENLMPYISRTAAKIYDQVLIFGDDYSTNDGTGERDYIHVEDLAEAHILALGYIQKLENFEILNIGTGSSVSVKRLIEIFCKVNRVIVPYSVVGRRDGDVGSCWSDIKKSQKLIGFKAEKDIVDMCVDTWRWQCNFFKIAKG